MINCKEIKQILSIEMVLDYYGISYPSGNKVMINCCFHDEKTPSLQIDKINNRFHCFGGSCGVKGDVIEFVKIKEGLEFKDALSFIVESILCEGATLRESEGAEAKRNCDTASLHYAGRKKENYKRNNRDEENIEVYKALYDMVELTGKGKKYLREIRGFKDETVMKYGFRSIDSPGQVFGGLKAKFGVERLRKAGLLTSRGKFLFWGGGILIPFWVKGEIIYFQYRLYEPYRKTKYLFLSGLRKEYFLGNVCKGDCFVFEGVFDAMAFCEMSGKDNFVAVGGTGEFDQEKILGYIANKTGKKDIRLIFCPDEHAAGISAVEKEAEKKGLLVYRVKTACEKLGIVCKERMDWNDLLLDSKKKII